MTVGPGAVYVLSADSRLTRIDPAGRVTGHSPSAAAGSFGDVAAGAEDVWLAGLTVAAFDPRTLVPVRPALAPPHNESGIAVGGGWVWVCDESAGTVWRVGPGPAAQLDRTVEVGARPTGVAFGAGAAWVTAGDGTVTRVDARTAQPTTLTIGGTRAAVAVGEGMVWVAVD